MVRREFLTGIAALGTTTMLLPRGESEAQMATTQPHRIDVHHHHTPPPYLAAIAARNIPGPVRDWTPEKSIADMDKAGVATSVTSITTRPGASPACSTAARSPGTASISAAWRSRASA